MKKKIRAEMKQQYNTLPGWVNSVNGWHCGQDREGGGKGDWQGNKGKKNLHRIRGIRKHCLMFLPYRNICGENFNKTHTRLASIFMATQTLLLGNRPLGGYL